MSADLTRREFVVATAGMVAATQFATSQAARAEEASSEKDAAALPVVVASGNGLRAVEKASELLGQGADPVDAVIAGVNLVEEDPEDITVGLGGLPNEAGVVQLDSSVMHGPTHNAGAVAALENIVHPSRVAKLVMERTDHVILVGAGALAFAKAHGFEEQNLLTDKSRRLWLKWKESLSDRDDWLSPETGDDARQARAMLDGWRAHHGTIHCSAVDVNGNIGGVTTTSGLAFKIPGRVGDSPIIGAGLYVDNAVGSAGATGRGEAVILNSGARSVVEYMKHGKSPEEACLAVLRDIADRTRQAHLLDGKGRPNYGVTLYAVSKSGRFGAATMWEGRVQHQFAVSAGGRHRLTPAAHLFSGSPQR